MTATPSQVHAASPWLEAAPSPAGLVALCLLVVYAVAAEPWLGVRFFDGLRRASRESAAPRARWLAALVAMQVCLSAVVGILVAALPGITTAAIGIRAAATPPILLGMVGGAFAGMAIGTILQVRGARSADSPKLSGDVQVLLPRTAAERAWLAAVALGAGTSEELLYRGLLPALAVAAGTPLYAALVGQALVFGLAHLYQGRVGVLATTVLGLAFGILVVWTGSLLLAVILHVLMDLRLAFMPAPDVA